MPFSKLNPRSILRSFALLSAAASLMLPVSATARGIDDIQMSRQGNVATADISLGCAMRYMDHTPQVGGSELRVRLSLGRDCSVALSGVLNELHRPVSRHMADMDELEFDVTAPEQATIVIRFEHPVGFKVSQGANSRALKIEVDPDAMKAKAADPANVPAPPTTEVSPATEILTAAPAAVVVEPEMIEPRDRRPLRLVPRREPATQDMFVISLGSYSSRETIDTASLHRFRSYVVHTTDVAINGGKWRELRIGFFTSEDQAQAELLRIGDQFPDAWISVVSYEEQAQAQANRLELAAAPRADFDEETGEPVVLEEAATMEMSEERIAGLMVEAKSALLSQNYDRSIKIYTRLLEEPEGDHRLEAREFLGVAREKKGQFAHATAEYQAFLAEFPEGTDTKRVEQRLAALTETADEDLRGVNERAAPEWNFFGAASQFYRRAVNERQSDEAEDVTMSSVLNQANVLVSRRGERLDLMGRLNMTYLLDLEERPGTRGDQALISDAYLDLVDRKWNLGARLGRQTRYTGGVLGRFDGAHISYSGWRPDLTFNLTAGFPVDSIYYEPNSDRSFVGISIDLANVADVWDFNGFVNVGEVDGISDREAVGAEVQYHNGRWNLVGLVDFDTSYEALNTALFVGNFRMNDRITLNGRISGGATPFFQTSNALIGQPVRSIRELLNTFTEPEIRLLARNRTQTETLNASLGVSMPLTERFHLNGDVGFYDGNGTVSSGGVVGIPDMDPSFYLNTNFIASSLFRDRDTVILGYRFNGAETYTMNTVTFDMRTPVGKGLRINPRIAVSVRDSDIDNAQMLIARPMLRVLYRWRQRFRVELELGGQWQSQDIPASMISPLIDGDTIETSVYYMNLGYWVDF